MDKAGLRTDDAGVDVPYLGPVVAGVSSLHPRPAVTCHPGPRLNAAPRSTSGRVMHPSESVPPDALSDPQPARTGPIRRRVATRVSLGSTGAAAGASGAVPVQLPTPLDAAQLQAWGALQRLHGPGELRALLLALVLTPGSAREQQAWDEEARGVHGADAVRGALARMPASAAPALLDAALDACVALPLVERQALSSAVRRVMCADGRVRPIDRLTLLLVRHRLAGSTDRLRASAGGADDGELAHLPLQTRLALAELTAYLARLVPGAAGDTPVGATVGAAGAAWYQAVVSTAWAGSAHPPACHVPDADALVHALQALQPVNWMRRPQIARAWVAALPPPGTAAAALSRDGALALRLACGLLDTPMPPDLARWFHVLPLPAV